MYQALYRAFRPETFEDLIGQEHIVKILRNQIESGNIGHAYLFCGTRGTGKTTTARLLAKALNCSSEENKPCGVCDSCKAIAAGNYMDVIEMDAASNNSVDDIRTLREEVNFPPVVAKKKVYIIDEVHMLSPQAFNAFLKTLEEPPRDTVFILCTTDPNKLLATVQSRCIRLDFRRVPENIIRERFKKICKEIGVEADDDALALIASNADGSVRDGLSLLELCIGGGKQLKREDVLLLLGIAGTDVYIEMTNQIIAKDAAGALASFSKQLSEGKETMQLLKDWAEHLRNLMVIKCTDKPENILNLSLENIEKLKAQADAVPMETIADCIRKISAVINDARWASKPRILAELAIIEMSR